MRLSKTPCGSSQASISPRCALPGRRRAQTVLLGAAMVAAVAGAAIAPSSSLALGTPTHGAGFHPRAARLPRGYVRLPGETVAALRRAVADGALRAVGATSAELTEPITVTVTLRRSDQAGFQRFLTGVTSPGSPEYRHYLTGRQLTRRYGPSRAAYGAVWSWLAASGFRITAGAGDRLTISARAPRRRVEAAFHTTLRQYSNGSFANVTGPALPRRIAGYVQSVDGLADVGKPTAPVVSTFEEARDECVNGVVAVLSPFVPTGTPSWNVWTRVKVAVPALLNSRYGLVGAIGRALTVATLADVAAVGAGAVGGYCLGLVLQATWATLTDPPVPEKIGLLEFDTFNRRDVSDWLTLLHGSPAAVGQLSEVPVNGGVSAPGAGESEVLLDIDAALGAVAGVPGTSVAVYDAAPQTSFAAMFNTMIEDGDTIISNSWAQCEDETPAAEARGIDSILAQAAASGITVLNGTGDHGSTCLDGSPDTVSVPADSPHATAVGGTSVHLGPGITYEGESWWNGAGSTPGAGQGGFGVSRLFPRPPYQNGLSSAPGRSVPDLAVDADPRSGIGLCQADAGGCPDGQLYGGTSMAAPELAGEIAVLDQTLGSNIGYLNTALYPLANTPAFHTPAEMSTDFAHVGLGDPDPGQIDLALTHASVGPVDPETSFVGSTSEVPADGSTAATVRVDLRDRNGFAVAGKAVTLGASAGSAVISPPSGPSNGTTGSVIFEVTDAVPQTVTLTAKDTSDGVTLATPARVTFVPPAATGAEISASPTTVADDGASTATIKVYLENGLERPAVSKTVKLGGGGSAAITPESGEAVTNAEGVATFTATDTADETVTFTAVDVTDAGLPVPGSAAVNFEPSASRGCPDTAPAPVEGSGIAVGPFVSSLPMASAESSTFGGGILWHHAPCQGAEPTFDLSGNMFVPNETSGEIYEFGPGGGAAGPATALPDARFERYQLLGLAFGRKDRLYATLWSTEYGNGRGPQVVELDPATGAVERVIATAAKGLPDFPKFLAVDPISGDVFTGDDGQGSGTEDAKVTRIVDSEGTEPKPTPYADVGGVQLSMAFAPDGTLYVGVGTGPDENSIVAVTASDSEKPGTVTPIKTLAKTPMGVAVAESDAEGHATALDVVEASGSIDRVDLTKTPATSTTIATREPPTYVQGAAVGPDGCLYYDDQNSLLKITGTSQACPAGAHSVSPRIALADSGPANPPTGSQTTVTATLTNFPDVADADVTFLLTGPNGRVKLVHPDASGSASFSYAGVFPGVDTIKALAESAGKEVESAPLLVHWTAGKETSVLSLNESQASGPLGQPAKLTATLSDISHEPATPIAGASVAISLTGHTCVAITNAEGNASCPIMPTGPLALDTITATYGGSETYTPSTASGLFADGGVGLGTPVAGGPPAPTAPTISRLTESHRRWREGSRLARASARKRKHGRKPPVGTTFAFVLNEPATVKFTFTTPATGRKVRNRCAAPNKHNANHKHCTHTITAGTLSVSGRAGTNQVIFQGRISPSKKLRPGRYTVALTATNASGKSAPARLAFVIVASIGG